MDAKAITANQAPSSVKKKGGITAAQRRHDASQHKPIECRQRASDLHGCRSGLQVIAHGVLRGRLQLRQQKHEHTASTRVEAGDSGVDRSIGRHWPWKRSHLKPAPNGSKCGRDRAAGRSGTKRPAVVRSRPKTQMNRSSLFTLHMPPVSTSTVTLRVVNDCLGLHLPKACA